VGCVFGYVIQRGGFCLTRAISNLALTGDTAIARAYVLALLVAMVGVQILQVTGAVEIPIRPLHWVANILGGSLFGVGMILAGGCSGSTWYRSLVKIFGGGLLMGGAALVAEGCNINQGLTNSATLAIGSLLTFASMGAGAWLTLWALYLR
jgi:uncharacterized protein